MKGESRCHAEKSKQTHSPTHPSIFIYPILAIDYLLWFWHAYFTFEAQVTLSSPHNITVGIPQEQYISPTLFQSREPLKWHCARVGLMSCICGYVYSGNRLILHVWHVYVVFFLQSLIKDVIQNNHALIECRNYKKNGTAKALVDYAASIRDDGPTMKQNWASLVESCTNQLEWAKCHLARSRPPGYPTPPTGDVKGEGIISHPLNLYIWRIINIHKQMNIFKQNNYYYSKYSGNKVLFLQLIKWK